jgi:hypothetical protein
MTLKYINKPRIRNITVEYDVDNEAGERGVVTEHITPSHVDSYSSDILMCEIERKEFYWDDCNTTYSVKAAFDVLSGVIKAFKSWDADSKNDDVRDQLSDANRNTNAIEEAVKELEESEEV